MEMDEPPNNSSKMLGCQTCWTRGAGLLYLKKRTSSWAALRQEGRATKRPEQVLLAALYVNSLRLRTSTSGVELFATILASRDSTYVWNRLSYAVSSREARMAEDCLRRVGQTWGLELFRRARAEPPCPRQCGVATGGGAAGEQNKTRMRNGNRNGKGVDRHQRLRLLRSRSSIL
jgi:hypothetical protein